MITNDETDSAVDRDERAQTPPPPIRRIRVDTAPTVAPPRPIDGALSPNATTTRARPAHGPGGPERMAVKELSVFYGEKQAVRRVSLPIRQGEVLAMIGPSGCGKTTLLRTLNRLTELTPGARREGAITLDRSDIDAIEVTTLRRRVSMVFQQPNPFPMSIFDNVAYALREQGRKRPSRKVL